MNKSQKNNGLYRRLFLFILLFFLFSLSADFELFAEEIPVPELSARVTDLTETLHPEEISNLENKLASFEKRKGSQIAVLIVPTTGDETIEQFGIKVAEKWKIGRSKIDDGAILIVAKNDRKLRIEVGYGLEGSLTDILSKRIIDDIIVGHLKNGEFYAGLDAGTDAMIAVIDGESLPEPSPEESPHEEEISNSFIVLFVVLFFVGLFL